MIYVRHKLKEVEIKVNREREAHEWDREGNAEEVNNDSDGAEAIERKWKLVIAAICVGL